MTERWFEQRGGADRVRMLAGAAAELPFVRPLTAANTHLVTTDGRRTVNFGTNDYLGLGEHPVVRQAAALAALEYGTGTGASRASAGELELHTRLEVALAAFAGFPAALTFVNGHATNVTTIGTLFGPDDVILHDRLAHNSMLEGIRLSGAKRLSFRHNDPESLEQRLRSLPRHQGRTVICIDGVYSMDGDVAPLAAIVDAKRRHGALLYLDDAHGVGTLGARGAGTIEHAGVDSSDIDILMGTLGKALGSCGGFIAAEAELIEYLRWRAPGFVFTAGVPAPQAAASSAALGLLREHPSWSADLRRRASAFRDALDDLVAETTDPTPIVPVLVPEARVFEVARNLNASGIRVFPITYPAVAPEASRLRFSVNRLHDLEDLAAAADLIRAACHPQPVAA